MSLAEISGILSKKEIKDLRKNIKKRRQDSRKRVNEIAKKLNRNQLT